MLDWARDRGVEHMECEAVRRSKRRIALRAFKSEPRLAGWRIFFREDFYGEAVEKNASRVA